MRKSTDGCAFVQGISCWNRLLQRQFAALEEPDSFEALAVDISQPVAGIVDSIVIGLRIGSSCAPKIIMRFLLAMPDELVLQEE